MLVFVIPLRGKAVSKDWGRVSAQCLRTLRSAAGQLTGEYKVILSGSDQPDIDELPENCHYVEDQYKSPTSAAEQMQDKYRKLHRGFIEARHFSPTHIMVLDSDDCVSNRLAQFVENNKTNSPQQSPGWLIRHGYIHDEGSTWVLQHSNDFHQFCGSSAILAVEDHDLPSSMDDKREDFFLLNNGHHTLENYFKEQGRALGEVPFRGSIYNTSTGESYTGFSLQGTQSRKKKLQRLLNYRPLSQSIRKEFGYYPIK